MDGCASLLDLVEPIFIRRGEYDHLANLMVVRGMLLRFESRYQDAIDLARRTKKLVLDHNLDKYYAYQAARLEGLGEYLSGQQGESSSALDEALNGFRALYEQQPSDRLKHDTIMVLTDIGMMSLLTGNILKAQGSFKEALTFSLTLRGNQGDLATCANNQAYISFLLGEYQQAWQFYEQALMAAEQVGWARSIVQILNGQAELLILVDEFNKAEELLHKAERVAASTPGGLVSPATYRELALLELHRGHFSKAMFYHREAALADRKDLDDPAYQVYMGAVYLAMEQMQVARDMFISARQRLHLQTKPNQLRSLGEYYLAVVEFYLGSENEALAAVKNSLREAAVLGYDTFLVDAVHRDPGVLQILAKKWKNKHLDTILARAMNIPKGLERLVPKVSQVDEPEKFSLLVKGFGVCEIRRNGEIIPIPKWQSAGARALFFYILDNRKVKRDDVALQFWPEFNSARVNSNFHTTLWRVRNAIEGKNAIAFDGQFYSIHPRVDVFYDVHEYESLVAQFKNLIRAKKDVRSIALQAMELYRGDFLPDIDLPWCNMRRQELQQKFLSFLEQYAANEFDLGNYEQAREAYEKAIGNNMYQDLLHLGLMKCLLKLKAPAAARKHYIQYRALLLKDLGVEPGGELRLLLE